MRLDVALRPIEAVSHHVRTATRIAPGRPALWVGIRMAAAMAVPLALSPWLAPATATSASLAGYFITLVDRGGAYRTRAEAMALASAGAVLAVLVGGMVAGTALDAPVVIVGFTACALAHHRGAVGASIANPVAVLLAISAFRADAPATLAHAIAGTTAGAAWAMVLALFLWPVRVYRPGRRALANVFAELSAYAAAMARGLDRGGGDRSALLALHRGTREQLELARSTLVAGRRGRGERDRGECLLALVHVAERVFGKLLVLEEELDAPTPRGDRLSTARLLHAHAATLTVLAGRVLDEHATSEGPDEPSMILPEAEHLRALLATNTELLASARDLIASLATGRAPGVVPVVPDDEPLPRPRLRDLFDLDSAVLRHALRIAIASSIAALVASATHTTYSYWILITLFLLLQPHRSTTMARTIQRVLGTVAGALIAAGLVAVIPDQAVLIGITIACAALGASMLQLNYGLFSLFVTPTFVLLAEIHTQDFTLVWPRVLYTLLAGAIAVLASALLWPERERAVFDELLGRVIVSAADYLDAVRTAILARAPMPSAEITRSRRAFGLALGNAEITLDRVIAERTATELIEPRMSALAAARRLGGAIHVLGSRRHLAELEPRRASTAETARTAEAELYALAGRLRGLPRVDASIDAVRATLVRDQ